MNAQHTQGRLTADEPTDSLHAIRDEKGRIVADVGYSGTTEGDKANARRLALCWNALLDAPTERLEQAVHLGITDVSLGNLFTARLELQAQRDELLAALERTTEMCEQYADWIKRNVMSADIEQHPYLPELEGAAEDARAAIAEVKGSL